MNFVDAVFYSTYRSTAQYRPFVCPICGTAVSEQATLVAHIRRHSEDRRSRHGNGIAQLVLMFRSCRTGPFPCDVEGCDKTFASAASLAVHKVGLRIISGPCVSLMFGYLSVPTRVRRSTSVHIATSRSFRSIAFSLA